MKLFNNEEILTSTDGNIVILTTHRIRSTNSYGWGQHNTTSIMLEKISSVQAVYKSYPILLVLAGLMGFIAFIVGNQSIDKGYIGFPIVIGFIFIVFYFATRKHICAIASDGGAKIAFETSNMNKELLLEFIDKVEHAKSNRVSQVVI